MTSNLSPIKERNLAYSIWMIWVAILNLDLIKFIFSTSKLDFNKD